MKRLVFKWSVLIWSFYQSPKGNTYFVKSSWKVTLQKVSVDQVSDKMLNEPYENQNSNFKTRKNLWHI